MLISDLTSSGLTFSVLVGFLHDLGLEMILVGEDAAVPLGHLHMLTDPDLLSHLYNLMYTGCLALI